MIGDLLGLLRQATRRAAGLRLRGVPGVSIARDARVAYEKIGVRAGCGLAIGARTIVDGAIQFERDGARVAIGQRTFFGRSLVSAAERVEVGDDVLIAWGCTIVDHDSHALSWDLRSRDVAGWYDGDKDWTHVPRAPVRIGDRAWLGFNVCVLKGVTIGEGAVIGAASVVTRDVPPYTLAVGSPARVVRELPRPADRSGR